MRRRVATALLRAVALVPVLALTLPGPAAAQLGTGSGMTVLGHYDTVDPAVSFTDVWVAAHPNGRRYAYLGTQDHGMHIVDVTEPTAPFLASQILPPGAPDDAVNAVKTNAAGDLAIAVGWNMGLWVIDVSDPTAPVTVRNGTANFHTLWLDGNHAYPVRFPNSLEIFDISDPANPVLLTTVTVPGREHDVVVFDDVAYLSTMDDSFTQSGGLVLFDVSDPAAPVQLGTGVYSNGCAELKTHTAWPSTDRRTAFVTDELGCGSQACTETGILRALDVSDPANITVLGSYAATNSYMTTAHNLMVVGDTAYVAWYQRGLHVVDVSDPTNLRPLARLETVLDGGCWWGAWGVHADACGLAHVLDMETGLWIAQVDALAATCPRPRWLRPGAVAVLDACDASPGGPGAGNGALDPGERVQLRVELENLGGAAATNVSARIVSAPAGVTVRTASALYPDIPAGGRALPSGPGFEIELAGAGWTCAQTLPLELSVDTADGGIEPLRVELRVGLAVPVLVDDFETDRGWTASASSPQAQGLWARGRPTATRFQAGAGDPRDPGPLAAVTGLAASADDSDDVDSGTVSWQSPAFDLDGFDAATVRYSRWYSTDQFDEDWLRAEVWPGGGVPPRALEVLGSGGNHWNDVEHALRPSELAAGSRLRFTAVDEPADSITEAGVDRVTVSGWRCLPCAAALRAGTPRLVGVCDPTPPADPGEPVEVIVPIENLAATPARGLRARLVSAAPEVEVRRSEAVYPDAAPGATVEPVPGAGLVVRVLPGAACGSAVPLELELRSDVGSAAATVQLPVGGGNEAVVFADSFDLGPANVVPAGWTAMSDNPAPAEIAILTTVEPVGLGGAPASPPNAVHIGRDAGCCVRYRYYLLRTFDLSAWAGTRLEVRLALWARRIDGTPDRFSIIAVDSSATSAVLAELTEPLDSFRDEMGQWRTLTGDLSALDLSAPIEIRLVSEVNGNRRDTVLRADAFYVDDFRIVQIPCTTCAAGPGWLLYRADVTDLRGPGRAASFEPVERDGVSIAGPYYALDFLPGPDPRDPVALENGVPLLFYQVGGGATPIGPIHVRKDGATVDIVW